MGDNWRKITLKYAAKASYTGSSKTKGIHCNYAGNCRSAHCVCLLLLAQHVLYNTKPNKACNSCYLPCRPCYSFLDANQVSRHAAAALMSSRSPLAASPLTTLLVSPLTSVLLGPCFNIRSSTSLFGGLLNCIGVFGNVVRSSWLNVGDLDHSPAFVPLSEPPGVLLDIVDDCGGPFSSSMGIYLAE